MSGRTPSLGTLNRQVEVLTRTTQTDQSGGQTTTYSSLGKVWALVEERPGGVQNSADGIVSGRSVQVTVRFRTDIEAGDRLVVDGNQHDIDHVADLNGRRAYVVCTCSAITAVGSRYE